MDLSYWSKRTKGRREFLRGAAAAGGAGIALSLVGCGSSDKDKAAPSASTRTGELDPASGKPGGSFRAHDSGYPPHFDLTTARGGHARIAGVTHSGIIRYKHGRAGIDGASIDLEPDVTQAMPEQPDPTTFVFKLRTDVKFHTGKTMTAEDVKYSLDKFAGEKSIVRDAYTWMESVTTPDAQTVVVKSKTPFADALQSLAPYNDPFILLKEFEESKDVGTKLVGTGPYVWVSTEAPVRTTVKKNLDYFRKPYPFFDDIQFIPSLDEVKGNAEFIGRQIELTRFKTVDYAADIKKQRPDALSFVWGGAGPAGWPRCDQPPFNDKRVRQALSMAIDRKQIRDAVYSGEGEDDQVLSIINTPWGFRKPKDLKGAKYWTFDPPEAKKLMAAAGFDTKPVEAPMSYGQNNQPIVDSATLLIAKWRETGVANIKDLGQTGAVFQNAANVGQYEGIGFFLNNQNVVYGAFFRNRYWSPPEGLKAPTTNVGHVYDPQLNVLMDKQLTQFNRDERKATFRDIEDIFAEQQYRFILSTYTQSWFGDPSVKNMVMPLYGYQGQASYFAQWWLEK